MLWENSSAAVVVAAVAQAKSCRKTKGCMKTKGCRKAKGYRKTKGCRKTRDCRKTRGCRKTEKRFHSSQWNLTYSTTKYPDSLVQQ
jgi:hypothetical protein